MSEKIKFYLESGLWKAWVQDNRKLLIKIGAVSLLILVSFVVFVIKGNSEEPIRVESSAAAGSNVLDSSGTRGDDETGTSDVFGAAGGAGDGSNAVQTDGTKLMVDVGGAVSSPTVAELPQGSRVIDAIEAAGGLTADADIDGLNRAAFVSDGEKIYVPKKGEVLSDSVERNASGSVTSSSQGSFGTSAGKININTADASQLQQLNGVGPATAEKIIRYRTENGRFASAEDLKKVSGIGDKTFEKMKEDICV